MTGLDLTGANVLVTGGSRGIGPQIARALSRHGARLGLVARSGSELDAVAAELAADGAVAVPIAGDVTSAEDRRRVVAMAESELGPLDVLVNNAGGDPQREFHRLTEGEIHEVIELNLTSAVLLGRIVLPGMLERGRGHIVNVSSMAGRTAFPYSEAYGAAKDGLIGFTRVLRGDYRRRGVSASALILGPIREAGVGARTAEELDMRLPRLMATPADVGKATIRAIRRDKAEIAVLPGPGRTLRAIMDRFPDLGPALNRLGGAQKTMLAVAELRERQLSEPNAS